MNAIPPDPEQAERTARHLAMLRELAEIGMRLARALGEQALAALEPAAETPDPPSAPLRTDPGLAFARISRAVRQTIALEARIAAGREAPPRPRRPGRHPDPHPDPRHATIRRVLHEAARADAGGAPAAHRLREIDERLDDELDADPDQDLSVEEIIFGIREELGLARDLSRQSDELIAALVRVEEDEAAADDEAADPDPPAAAAILPPSASSPPPGPDPPP